MLRKLLKYDLQANMKIYLLVWPALLVLALIDRLSMVIELKGSLGILFTATSSTLFVLGEVGAIILTFVISIIRFYSGLLRSEGYLMFTLPVKPWQLILSKFLTALLTITVTLGLVIANAAFVLNGVDGLFLKISHYLGRMDIPGGITLALICLIVAVSICDGILQIYTACSIGHQFRRKRVLLSIVFYYAINITIEILAVSAIIIIGSNQALEAFFNNDLNVTLAIILGVQIILGAIFFFVSERLLRKRLNLE